uniref:Uncharacterized protein n=1 Tax=Anguilla anguilla TaxID=7936 RepID=A0A0E9PH71_ANGAN
MYRDGWILWYIPYTRSFQSDTKLKLLLRFDAYVQILQLCWS